MLRDAHPRGLLSDEHCTVDGTLLDAWASQKSVERKDGSSPPPTEDDPSNPTVHFRTEKRSNVTHQSVTDPACRLAKKSTGAAAQLAYLGSVLTENRHGFVVQTHVTQPSGTAECAAAVAMLTTLRHRAARLTLGGDKLYDQPPFSAPC